MVHLFTTVAGLSRYLALSRKHRWPFQPSLSEEVDGAAGSVPESVRYDQRFCVGLVPTMGALHEGHLSLIRRARQENELVVVSIFVNPLQFGPNEDLHQYPRTMERDRHLCEEAGVNVIFAPSIRELYRTTGGVPAADAVTQVIPPAPMLNVLCGRTRVGHFEGVTTVVTRLFNLTQPDRAYFGEKDAQQLAILRQLVQDLKLPVALVGCPIIRDANGLALSSRNQYLSTDQKDQAAVLYRSLKRAESLFRQGQTQATELIHAVKDEIATVPTVNLEYVDLVHPRTLTPLNAVDDRGLLAIAARIDNTRLIDNIMLNNRRPIIAIDGPAGAGKSTVAQQVAQILDLLYLDTGAMYRAVTWLVLQSDVAIEDEPAIAELASQCRIKLVANPNQPETPASGPPCQVWVNNQEVTQAIRTPEVTAQVSAIAAQGAVREILVQQQQRQGQKGGIVLDGRDIGTHVFPDAELKIFLTATVQERARRRQFDLQQQGYSDINLAELEATIQQRDHQDSTRTIAPLRKATDALEISTDDLTIDEVNTQIVELYQQIVAPKIESQMS
ncbi:MAG: bifunctional pantoate--beta-alanine ligase/(d)CMP kinase [Cyanothece sp. SIO2G6]|nr:bifunctional pantoate--beta-alanine ligase/(d)CMP kinase [Cyanothece sp. SIO2G6]